MTDRSSPLTVGGGAPSVRPRRDRLGGGGAARCHARPEPPAGPAGSRGSAVAWRCLMTATPQPQWTPAPAPRWGAGRIVALVLGVLLLLPGLALLLGGGVLLWADTAGRNDDGYVFSDRDGFTTDQFALVSDRIDLATG